MGSTYLPLTDDELLEKVMRLGGEVMLGTWNDPRTGRWEAGMRKAAGGLVMALSSHDDEEAAVRALKDLEDRLDRLVRERRGLTVRNPMDDPDDRTWH